MAAAGRPVWRRRGMRVLVWATFAWVAVIVGFFVYAGVTADDRDQDAARLVGSVDAAMRSATASDPGLREALVTANRMQPFDQGTDVLSLVPDVRGARPYQFAAERDGSAVIDYRLEDTTNEVCVRTVLPPSGDITTTTWSCRAR